MVRIVSQWQDSDEAKTVEEIAEALAFNSWKIALNALKSMQDEKLYFVSKSQGFLVMTELMIFQIQLADRMAYSTMSEQERTHFVQRLAKRCLDMMVDNRVDLQGDGEYRDDFVTIMNQRLQDYAAFTFDAKTGPGYQSFRYLGEKIGQLMGDDQDNKWTIDQVMEIEGPDVYRAFEKSMSMLSG